MFSKVKDDHLEENIIEEQKQMYLNYYLKETVGFSLQFLIM